MSTADRELDRVQHRYKRNFEARVRRQCNDIKKGSYLPVCREYFSRQSPRYKFTTVFDGPCAVIDTDERTVVVKIINKYERLLHNREVWAPPPATAT